MCMQACCFIESEDKIIFGRKYLLLLYFIESEGKLITINFFFYFLMFKYENIQLKKKKTSRIIIISKSVNFRPIYQQSMKRKIDKSMINFMLKIFNLKIIVVKVSIV